MDNNKEKKMLITVLKFSAWGYVLVIFSALLCCAGYWVDKKLNTAPIFMIGLFLLAVSLYIIRLCQQASKEYPYLKEEGGMHAPSRGGIKDG